MHGRISPWPTAPLSSYPSVLQVNWHVALFLCDLGKGNGLCSTCSTLLSLGTASLPSPSLPTPAQSSSQAAPDREASSAPAHTHLWPTCCPTASFAGAVTLHG